jgi:pentatricopeptide repeat protein
MQFEGICPNEITFSCVLQACSSMGMVSKGKEVHAHIEQEGMLGKSCMLDTALVDMYAKCGEVATAKQVSDCLPTRDVVSWTALISGYAQHDFGEEAFRCFHQMQYEGLCPNEATFACVLQACGSMGALQKGTQVHATMVRKGSFRSNNVLGTALIDMYAKCGDIAKAQQAFEDLSLQDVVSWTALIGGYTQHGKDREAIMSLQRMWLEGLSPNSMTLVSALKACGKMRSIEKGREIHAIIRSKDGNSTFGSALVDMYARCGELTTAQKMFDQLCERDIVSWTALMLGYADHGHGDEALRCYELLSLEGLLPNGVTFACILKACGSMGAVHKGEEIHGEITRGKFLKKSAVLGSALIDMYAKCGVLTKAQQVFDELPIHNVVSWTSLMAGYAQLGEHDVVFKLFYKMIIKGLRPNAVTFVVLLSACNDAGLINEGQLFFELMSSSYGISPALEHFTCMVNLFSRTGHFHEAMAVIKTMPFPCYLPAWVAVLNASREWGNVKLGKLAFDNVYVWTNMIENGCETAKITTHSQYITKLYNSKK